MECWTPDPDEPQLLRWWEPLLLVARRAREDQVPWPIHIDEFTLAGRTDRRPRPSVWVYRHRVSERLLLADDYGRTYEFVAHQSGPSRGRFKEIGVSQAVWAVGLPNVAERVWYEYPDEPGPHDPWADADAPGPADGRPSSPAPSAARRRTTRRSSSSPGGARGRRRGHLRLVSGDDAT